MAPPSSSNPSSSPSFPPRSHLFTPIEEGNESEETEEQLNRYNSLTAATTATATATATPSGTSTSSITHQSTPFHHPSKKSTTRSRRLEKLFSGDRTVSCNDCRPTHRQKIILPFDNNSNTHSSLPPSTPNNLFKTFLAGISRRSPRTPVTETPSPAPENEERLKVAVAELSRKLVQATRRRDEAISESSKLKYSMSELEKKLNRLEVYCNNLKDGLENCGFNHQFKSPSRRSPLIHFGSVRVDNEDDIIKEFLASVSEARSSIRFLSKSLTSQLKLMGVKVFERLSTLLLRSYDIKLSSSSNPKSLQFYLEALLNNAFFLDFESVGFERSSTNRVLNPIERSESNYMGYASLKELAWEEVLNKGTKHFSEEFSRFCDRKMSEIVAMFGWNRAWPEQLLQAFFGASKSVWLVHLLANSVHPSLTIFRVEKGVGFDPVYMEDMGGDKAKKLIPIMVRIMVTPGFYVYDNVVKCKVICRYYDNDYNVLHANGASNYTSGDDNARSSISLP